MPDWRVGEVIQDRWEVRRTLQGGMGVVHAVYDRQDRKVLAAKSFPEEVFAKNAAVAQIFAEEAVRWVALDVHPNVAWAQFVKTIGGRPFVFVQYVPGGDLSRWVGSSKVPAEIFRFAIQLCDAMIHVLSKGIRAHRDIKPENCLVTQFGTLVLTDFGLAKATGFQEQRGRGGTAEYMPPEQWDDFNQADERSDIYAFGATLYHLWTGRPPFGNRPTVTVSELERRHKYYTPPRLETNVREFDDLIARCLQKAPGRRPQGFHELREELGAIAEAAGVRMPPVLKGLELDASVLSNKGYSLDELGYHAEAIECYDAALGLNPHSPMTLSNRGVALAHLGNYQAALDSHEQALVLDPHFAPAWSNKGDTLDEMGRSEEALECYARAILEDPLYGGAWYNKALALDQLGRTDEALRSYDEALRLEPWNERAWANKGSLLKSQGRAQEAMVCYERALTINPRLEEALYNKAVHLDLTGRHEEALIWFDKAIQVNAVDSMNWYGKGVALSKLGRHREAVDCYAKSIELDANNVKAWVNLGSALLAVGDPSGSLAASERAASMNPRNAGTWYNLGLAHRALRHQAQALRCLENSRRLGHGGAAAMLDAIHGLKR